MKTRRDFQSILIPVQDFSSLPWLVCFPVAKMSKAQRSRDRNMDTIMDISTTQGQPPLLYNHN